MAAPSIKVKSTKNFGRTVKPKCVIYGASGVGKTTLASTAPRPLIISAEKGLLSLSDHDVPYVEIETFQDILDLFQWLTENPEAKEFETLIFDSITDVCETVLEYEKTQVNDKRQAYMALADKMMYILRQFRDLPQYAVVFLAKLDKTKDEATGAVLFAPMMPGQVLTKQLPYLVDEVFAYDLSQPDQNGKVNRFLRTAKDWQWDAKDRSGRLAAIERPNLTWIFDKLQGFHPGKLWYYHVDNEEYVQLTGRAAFEGINGGHDLTKIGNDESKAKHEAYMAKQKEINTAKPEDPQGNEAKAAE